jgi:hypothetical protein
MHRRSEDRRGEERLHIHTHRDIHEPRPRNPPLLRPKIQRHTPRGAHTPMARDGLAKVCDPQPAQHNTRREVAGEARGELVRGRRWKDRLGVGERSTAQHRLPKREVRLETASIAPGKRANRSTAQLTTACTAHPRAYHGSHLTSQSTSPCQSAPSSPQSITPPITHRKPIPQCRSPQSQITSLPASNPDAPPSRLIPIRPDCHINVQPTLHKQRPTTA